MNFNRSIFPFLIVACTLFTGAWALPVIREPATRDQLADLTSFWGIPNTVNVLSSLAWFIVGIYGFLKRPRFRLGWQILMGLITFLVSTIALGTSSIFYHWTIHNYALLGIRMSSAVGLLGGITFALLSVQLNVKNRWAIPWYLFLQGIAVASTLYHFYMDDLSFYIMLNFFPLIVLLLSIIRLQQQERSKDLSYGLFFYVLSQLIVLYSHDIYQGTSQWVHGHTLTHVLAATGSFFLLRFFIYLKPIEISDLTETHS